MKKRMITSYGTKIIDIEPTWESLVPTFVALIERGDVEGRNVAIYHMRQMAKISDWVRQAQKKGIKTLKVPAAKKLRKVI